MNCSNDLGFVHYFEQNMNALGLPAPTTPYSTVLAIAGPLKGMSDAIVTYGRTATLTQLAMRITWGFETAPIVARASGFILAMGAAYYTGAMIGSAAVATYKANSCGASILDVLAWARHYDMDTMWLEAELRSSPEILARIT